MRQWNSMGLGIVITVILSSCGGGGGMMKSMEEDIHDQIGEIGKNATRIISTALVVTASQYHCQLSASQ